MNSACLTDAEILALALSGSDAQQMAGARHLAGCANCRARVDAMRALLSGAVDSASAARNGHECLDELELAALADGGATDALRGRAVAHLADCGHCRESFASLMQLLADPAIAGEIRRLENPNAGVLRWRIGAGVAAIAAAVVLIFTAPVRRPSSPSDTHRGPTITAAEPPRPIAPVGDVVSATALRWNLVSGAARYRATLFDTGGAVLFEAEVADTFVALPDSVAVVPGRTYLWKVDVRTEWDRWATSDLIEFRLAGADPTSRRGAALRPAPDSLRLQLRQLSDSELVIAAHDRATEVRDALAASFALVVHGPTSSRADELNAARRLGAAHAAAWHDDFLSRQVALFAASSPERRLGKVSADSLRRAGAGTYASSVTGAIAVWRRALARAQLIADTAGIAATLGNIGAAFARNQKLDSAGSYLDRARRLAAGIGDHRTEANALSELAGLSEQRSDAAAARQQYAAALALHERIGDVRGLASDHNNLAGLAQAAGDFVEAQRQLETALAINRRANQPQYAATNLVNLATLAMLAGDFGRAEKLYREALATWRVRKQWADVADVMHDLGRLDLRRGDYAAARANLAEALPLYARAGLSADALAVRQELAGAKAASGDMQGALDDLRGAQRFADSVGVAPAVRARILLASADLSVQLNARPEAERLYAAAELLARRGADRDGEAAAQEGEGALLASQGNYARAQELLERALRIESASGNQRAAALTRMQLGVVTLQLGDTVGARRQLTRASVDLERLGDPVAAAAVLGERAALESGARLPAAAESLYRAALARIGVHLAPEVTWRLHAGLGAVRRDRGALDDAARELRVAIADVEASSGSLAVAARRSAFLTDKWDVYRDLALVEHARGNAAASFEVSERLRAGEMREMLAGGRVATPVDTSSELVALEQDLRRRIAELTRGLEVAPKGVQQLRGPDVSGGGAVTREALLQAQAAYTNVLLEMRERAPRHAALVAPAIAAWHDVARQLAPDEAFIEYLVGDANSIAFVLTRDTIVTVRLVASRRDLARLVEFVRGTLQPRGDPRLDSLWRGPLRQLNRDLIAPIEASGILAGKKRLTVVPHEELHYVPFAALLGDGPAARFLIERFDVSIAPSASVWLALGTRPRARAASGIVAFAPRPDALPASRDEVAAVSRFGGASARVFIGATATEAEFRREAPTHRVIHLATYGVLNKQNPLFSFIELAGGAGGDGRLETREVFGLQLSADLVILSACQTALGSGAVADIPSGDDWIGLARAFLSAGASRVIATLWPVQDRATATLMERFYERYRLGNEPGPALAAAQRALLANPATANPYFWAGFEVIGGR